MFRFNSLPYLVRRPICRRALQLLPKRSPQTIRTLNQSSIIMSTRTVASLLWLPALLRHLITQPFYSFCRFCFFASISAVRYSSLIAGFLSSTLYPQSSLRIGVTMRILVRFSTLDHRQSQASCFFNRPNANNFCPATNRSALGR